MKQLSAAQLVKIAIIPILCVVLYLVLPGKGNVSDSTGLDGAIAQNANGKSSNEQRKSIVVKDQNKPTNWPVFKLKDLDNIDPMDRRRILPEVASPASSADTNTDTSVDGKLHVSFADIQVKRLDPSTIKAIFQSPKGIAALVEDRIIHVGDRLADGTEVIGITPDELTVSASSTY